MTSLFGRACPTMDKIAARSSRNLSLFVRGDDTTTAYWASQSKNELLDQPPAGLAGLAGRAGRAGRAGLAGRAALAARAGRAGRAVPATRSFEFHATTQPL